MKKTVDLDELVKNTPCPCDYSCLKKGYCCKATSERVIDGTIVSIVPDNDSAQINCNYYIGFGGGSYCSCPVHVELCRRGLLKKPCELVTQSPKAGDPQTGTDADSTA
ncbi:MAG: hypothetical protein J7K75_10715 [Desulfuromonas sp.]|nr:hypothetical protein [Desulfuromonas sp.]